ncbi:DEAD/DEAH box helicase [bacterium]|nr:DEAD/DEAH box helicase [bacterium]
MLASPAKSLDWAHPIVSEWFTTKFGTPTEPQIAGWPVILSGQDALICAPTGSGKTLAAFLACLDSLVRKSLAGKLEPRTEVVYISPLKALSNDVQKNLDAPLAEILQLAQSKGIETLDIRTAVRTGDTLASDRQKMIKKPPHILVTTPESLYILLTAEKSRQNLRHVTTVIVDEIHAVADDKRGTHLSLTLERLDALAVKKPVRIGLSATQRPLELIGRFLVGNDVSMPKIIEVTQRRHFDLSVVVPQNELQAVASQDIWTETYDYITELVKQHRSTLVFVNTRKLSERLAYNLSKRLGDDVVGAHHGSLARNLRLDAEQKLKSGQLKVLVATASLELGIDIGSIDLVCQIGSPRSIAAALQRVGRAGHWRGATPKGRLFATTRDELVECAAIVKAIQEGEMDRIVIPDCALDVLAQQIIAACAASDWREADLFAMVKRAYPYRDLSYEEFDRVLEMVSEGVAGRNYSYGRFVHRDRINKILKGRRGARLAAVTNAGTIPETNVFTVIAEPDEQMVGTLDEDFSLESNAGDIILLGNTSWIVKKVEGIQSKVRVIDAKGAPPTVPFWLGEGLGRTIELSQQVAEIRELVVNAKAIGVSPMSRLTSSCGLCQSGAEQVTAYINEGVSVLGAVPTQKRLIAERFFDESGGMQLIIHSPFGARINKAWGLALRKKFCQSFNFELQAAATDNGINISLTDKHSFPLGEVFHYLHPNTLRHVLEQTALQAPLFTVRFRWDATRSLALLRYSQGKKTPPHLQRMRAEDLLASVFPQAAACQDNVKGDIDIPDHPLINEVMKDVLTEAMDIDGLSKILEDILSGEIECLAVDTPMPSAFAAEILNANPYAFLDDAPLEERRARAVGMRRALPDDMARELGGLDLNAIEQVRHEAFPDIRNADEMHDLLMSLVFLPIDSYLFEQNQTTREYWQGLLNELALAHRACILDSSHLGKPSWIACENLSNLSADQIESEFIERAVYGLLMHVGPITEEQIFERLGFSIGDIQFALVALETRGTILRGSFTPSNMVSRVEWCERGLLSRIHRLTIGSLRKQIEAVSPAQYMDWLFNWQHVSSLGQLIGEHGTLEVLRQLQGFEIAANAWETQILPQRVKNYNSTHLDKLCLTGQVGWGRLSRHPSVFDMQSTTRVTPNGFSPIAFYLREEGMWYQEHEVQINKSVLSTQGKLVLEYLERKGASFFFDIVRSVKLVNAELETALWELVTAGLVTADGFENMRSIICPRRRQGLGKSKNASMPRHSPGRWSLLLPEQSENAGVEAACWMLLRRYGIVFRELLSREVNVPKWRDLLNTFRRMEARGEIRGGRFINGFIGEQFASQMAVDSLRASKTLIPAEREIVISACDPLNLVNTIVPGAKVAVNSGQKLLFVGGVYKE